MHIEPGLLAQPKLLFAAGAAAVVLIVESMATLAVLWVIQRVGQSCLGALCFAERSALSTGKA